MPTAAAGIEPPAAQASQATCLLPHPTLPGGKSFLSREQAAHGARSHGPCLREGQSEHLKAAVAQSCCCTHRDQSSPGQHPLELPYPCTGTLTGSVFCPLECRGGIGVLCSALLQGLLHLFPRQTCHRLEAKGGGRCWGHYLALHRTAGSTLLSKSENRVVPGLVAALGLCPSC